MSNMSDVEKRSVSRDSQDENRVGSIYGLPPDPDAHLSEEEREEIVSITLANTMFTWSHVHQ